MIKTTLASLLLLCAQLLPAAAAAQKPAPVFNSANTPTFTLVNRTPQAISELFVTPSGLANWGQNRLDGKPATRSRPAAPSSIPPGGSFVVVRRTDNNCIFDMRVVFADGKSEERKGVNVCSMENVVVGSAAVGAPVASSAPDPVTGKAADDPSVTLFNRAAVPLTEFYATPSGLTDWGKNRLDTTPLTPDHTRPITIARDGNCIFDLRVVFADKRSREKKRTNLCKQSELPIP